MCSMVIEICRSELVTTVTIVLEIMDNNKKSVFVDPLIHSIDRHVEALITNVAEVGIDVFLDEGVLKEIPIISSVISFYKIGHSIKELAYIKKLSIFIQELNNGIADDEKRKEYISQIEADRNRSQHEIEYLLLMIDRVIQYEKSRQLAKLYLSYLNKDINWISLCQYSEVLDRMLPWDYEYLDINVLSDCNRDSLSNCALQRLEGLGIIVSNDVAGAFDINGNTLATRKDGTYNLTAFGNTFYQIVIATS